MVLDPNGPSIDVMVFESSALPDHWARLDAFEGPGCRRELTAVFAAGGVLAAAIYVLADG